MQEGKVVNDYVNSNVPSQVRYSIYMLNQESDTTEYPEIRDISTPQRTLRTAEEREKLEEELKALNNK